MGAKQKMPLYRSHKIVEAAKIVEVIRTTPTDAVPAAFDVGVEGASEFIHVDAGPLIHKLPSEMLGGYLVRYDDGYVSWSPAKAFEEGYDLVPKSTPGVSREQAIEAEIQSKGSTAPRLTPALIDATIVSEFFFTAGEGVLGASEMGTKPAGRADSLNRLTICVLVLANGYTVTGESACASAANFNAELGRKIARDNARNKIWALEGYLLRQQLFEDAKVNVAMDAMGI